MFGWTNILWATENCIENSLNDILFNCRIIFCNNKVRRVALTLVTLRHAKSSAKNWNANRSVGIWKMFIRNWKYLVSRENQIKLKRPFTSHGIRENEIMSIIIWYDWAIAVCAWLQPVKRKMDFGSETVISCWPLVCVSKIKFGSSKYLSCSTNIVIPCHPSFYRFETDKHELVLGQILCLEATGGSSTSPPVINKCHEMGGDQEWKHRKTVYAPSKCNIN